VCRARRRRSLLGRLHREHHAKREVTVYDYVDSGVPFFACMVLSIEQTTAYRRQKFLFAYAD